MERTILNKTPNYDYIISVYKKLILQSKIPVSSYLGDCSEKGMYFDYKGVAELFNCTLTAKLLFWLYPKNKMQ